MSTRNTKIRAFFMQSGLQVLLVFKIYGIKSLGNMAERSSLLISHKLCLKCVEDKVDTLSGLVLPN